MTEYVKSGTIMFHEDILSYMFKNQFNINFLKRFLTLYYKIQEPIYTFYLPMQGQQKFIIHSMTKIWLLYVIDKKYYLSKQKFYKIYMQL